MTLIQGLSISTVRLFDTVLKDKIKICYRCKNDDREMNMMCLNCKRAIYCNKKCMNKNAIVHENVCGYYVQNSQYINNIVAQAFDNMYKYEAQVFVNNDRKLKDKRII